MESLVIAWRYLLLISVFAFPQLLGILLYFRLGRAPRWMAVIAGVMSPAIVFVLLAPIFIFAGVREAYARGEACGMPALAAVIFLFFGTIIQLVLAVISQVILRSTRR